MQIVASVQFYATPFRCRFSESQDIFATVILVSFDGVLGLHWHSSSFFSGTEHSYENQDIDQKHMSGSPEASSIGS